MEMHFLPGFLESKNILTCSKWRSKYLTLDLTREEASDLESFPDIEGAFWVLV